MGRFRQVAVLDEPEMALSGYVVLEVEGRVHAAGLDRQPSFSRFPFFVPIPVEVHVPFLDVGAGIDVGPETAQLALFAHHGVEQRRHAWVAHKRVEDIGFPVQQGVEPHVADGIQAFFPTLFLGVENAGTNLFRLHRGQGALEEHKSVPFQLIEFFV